MKRTALISDHLAAIGDLTTTCSLVRSEREAARQLVVKLSTSDKLAALRVILKGIEKKKPEKSEAFKRLFTALKKAEKVNEERNRVAHAVFRWSETRERAFMFDRRRQEVISHLDCDSLLRLVREAQEASIAIDEPWEQIMAEAPETARQSAGPTC